MAVAYETSLTPAAVTFNSGGEAETVAFDAGTGANRTLVVFVTWRDQDNTISGVTYNAVAMTSVAARLRTADTLLSGQLWYLVNPASGSNNIVVTMGVGGSNSPALISAWVANGTDTAGTPIDGYVTASGTASTANIASSPGAISSATDDMIVIFASNRNGTDNWTATPTNYTERQDAANGSGISATFGDAAGAASVTPTATWNNSADELTWLALGINVNQTAGGGGGRTTHNTRPSPLGMEVGMGFMMN